MREGFFGNKELHWWEQVPSEIRWWTTETGGSTAREDGCDHEYVVEFEERWQGHILLQLSGRV